MPRPKSERRLAWPVIGWTLVVAAFGLAAGGIALALQQAEALSTRLTVHAQARAGQIAKTAADLFHYQLNAALRGAAERVRLQPDLPWTHSPDWPSWIVDLYTWDGQRLIVLTRTSSGIADIEELLRVRTFLPAMDPFDESTSDRAALIYDETATTARAVAILRSLDARESPMYVVGVIDPKRLKSELLDPLVALDDGLKIVPTSAVNAPWSQTITGALRLWSIEPSAEYAREQRNIVVGQTVAYLGLTLVSLGTMLAAMWSLSRVARREINLADLKSNFVADVSHELKTPLALIRLYGETLMSGRVTSEDRRNEYYAVITRESTRLTNLINNILDFSRIDAGKKEYRLEEVDVGEVVRETFEAYRAELDDKGFERRLQIAGSLPRVSADRDAIAQAVLNLLSNAVKYSDDDRFVGVEVRADTRRDVEGVLISVEDRGIGIRPEDRAHLFEGFYRAPDGRVRQRSGTGLGLSVVKHIVDAHHGTLDVESRLVRGSKFTIFLPAHKAARTAVRDPVEPQAAPAD